MTRYAELLRVCLVGASLALSGCDFLLAISSVPTFRGLEAVAPTVATDFALTTHAGQRIRLGELKGRVVVLAFWDTECPAECEAAAPRILETAAQVDYYREAGRVVFLAVTTAPERDTPEKAARLAQRLKMPANFAFLTGSRDAVEPVWIGYGAAVAGSPLRAQAGKLVLIDPQGTVQGYMAGAAFKPEDLRHNIRLLLSEHNLLTRPLCH